MTVNSMIRLSLVTLLALGLGGCEATDLPGDEASPVSPDDPFDSGSDSDGSAPGTPSCAPVAQITCGSHVVGDTSDFNSGATSELDSYPVAVGNYEAREITYSFVAPQSGAVSFELVDPVPTAIDHDLFLLSAEVGCSSEAALQRGHNDLSVMAEAGESYYLVVDGYNGAEGAFELAVECSGSNGDLDWVPAPGVYDECLFGLENHDLNAAPHLVITLTGRFETPASVPALVGQQLVAGIQQDGWTPPLSSVEEAFDYVDPDGLYLYSVRDAPSGDRYSWIKFYAGDTEVGYLYREGSMEQVAIVSDGDIQHCRVSGG